VRVVPRLFCRKNYRCEVRTWKRTLFLETTWHWDTAAGCEMEQAMRRVVTSGAGGWRCCAASKVLGWEGEKLALV